MMFQSVQERYHEMNRVSSKHGVVFFGSSFLADYPVCELAQNFRLDEEVFNRSVKGLDINEVSELLQTCVFDLAPQKVFINLGEEDVRKNDFNIDKFISQYEWILYQIHTHVSTEIYLVSVISNEPDTAVLNERIKALADDSGCKYIDVSGAKNYENENLQIFDLLKFHIRTHPLSFYDAMNMGAC